MPETRSSKTLKGASPEAQAERHESDRAGRASHAGPQRMLAQRLEAAGALHPGLTVDTATGPPVVCASPETVERFVADCGWPHDRIEQELTAAIVRALCPAKMARRRCLEVPSGATTMRP